MPFSLAACLILAASSLVSVNLMTGDLAIGNDVDGIGEGSYKQFTQDDTNPAETPWPLLNANAK
jgi:hypothetical protein